MGGEGAVVRVLKELRCMIGAAEITHERGPVKRASATAR